MSAANLVQTSGEPSDAKPREPSMEDILASIRRIIAQDQALFAAEDASREEAGQEAGSEEVNDGADSAVYGLAQSVAAQGLADHQEENRARGEAADPSEPVADWGGAEDEPLVSKRTDDSVAGAFNALIASRFAQNSDAVLAMTREALRPLLEAWLDAHLPALVERLVRAEIERMTKGD
jgi:hypothetical protein